MLPADRKAKNCLQAIVLSLFFCSLPTNGFLLPPNPVSFPTRSTPPPCTQLFENKRIIEESIDGTCWNPKLRKSIGTIASFGIAETAYLTATKVMGNKVAFCSDAATSCGNVLDSPYAFLPGTQIPLASLGLLAYTTVAFLALEPLLSRRSDDEQNRIMLTATTTTMGVFSVFLMTLLFGVMKQSCPYCLASATFSIILAKLCWLGGCVPSDRIKQGIKWSTVGGSIAFIISLLIFVSNDTPETVYFAGQNISSDSKLLAEGKSPPPIQSQSSDRAMNLANRLESLDAKMFGAYWCSHCYDQKERFGREAFRKISYIECSKEGIDSQAKFCRENDVPGYPTWSIDGKLYPGEKDLDELEELVNEISKSGKNNSPV